MTELAIEATGLAKSFSETKALAGVDLAARRGSVLAVLGPNGAGKTTAVRILATLLRADAGTARVNGFDVRKQPDKVRESVGDRLEHPQPRPVGDRLQQRLVDQGRQQQRLKLADAGGGTARVDLSGKKRDRRVQPQFLKAAGERPREVPGIRERRTAPQRQCLRHGNCDTAVVMDLKWPEYRDPHGSIVPGKLTPRPAAASCCYQVYRACEARDDGVPST